MSPDPTDPTDPIREPSTAAGPDDRPAPDGPPPGLSRSADDRMLFGVCGGIAERYGMEPLLVRLAFVATLFLGGAGVLFYLAAALLIPAAPGGAAGAARQSGPAASAAGGVLRALVGIAVAIAAFTALCTVAVVSFGTTALLGAWPAALGLLLLGGLLVVSARGRRATGALLVLALALAVPATAAVVADVDVDRSVGERDFRPGTVARAEQGYRLGAGQMVVDLRDLPLRRGQRVTIPARVDVGQVGVVLPRDRCVAWTIRTDLGAAGGYDVLGSSSGGGSWTGNGDGPVIEVDPAPGADDDRPRVTLDLRVGVGHVAVAQSRGAIDGPGPMARGIVRRGDDLLRTSACRTSTPRRRG
ncbi:PspC domain-containing protein [Patulibacter sp.]|uniref:PspC domain-containing protein n=1 Tax=Patulibacter sp. TaxID=1912859 RepID=UPI00271B14B0|nr:PspC domain-containing protein [Patulibacter sp.]MDO9409670.1 PspC domain-containing protein [Patulibacter sp.]